MYEGIASAAFAFERSLQRILESEDGQNPASSSLCHAFLECTRALTGSVSQGSIEEMKQMKTAVKDRLAQYEFDLKQRSKEVDAFRQALEKAEHSFAKTQAEIRRVHAKSVETGDGGSSCSNRRRSFSWSPMRTESKDELFDKLQKLVHEQSRLSAESECVFNQVSSAHQVAYTRFNVVVNEVASIRRRLNRRTCAEVKNITASMSNQLVTVRGLLSQLAEKAEECCPSTGDFGMRLPMVNDSLSSIIGNDASNRIKAMLDTTESRVIEYRAVQSYIAKERGELSFNRNDKIEVVKKDSSGWWVGKNLCGQIGLFPSVFVAQRPAGAMLPLQQAPAVSYKPDLAQGPSLGTWINEAKSEKDRAHLISNNPPFTFIGVVHFPFNGAGISVEPGEIVDVQQLDKHSSHSVIVVNDKGIKGVVPIHVMTLKYRQNEQENDRNFDNWSL